MELEVFIAWFPLFCVQKHFHHFYLARVSTIIKISLFIFHLKKGMEDPKSLSH